MKIKPFIAPIIMFIMGIVLLLVPGGVITTVIKVFGVIIIVGAVLSIINTFKNNSPSLEIIYGILIGILGIVFLVNPEVIASIIPLILGIWITLKSLFKLRMLYAFKNNSGIDFMKPLIINILMLILGIVLIFNPFSGAEALIRIIAIFILFYSILDITELFLTRPKKVKVIR